ncbi:hypothetical protein J4G37_56535, partial [Microvirga sp. 3-52]|nr:hypothetical protein [Microvirga sp. 3-52]
MTSFLMIGIAIFIIAIQAAIPYLLKPTIVFGVTIPHTYTKNPTLFSYKRIYSLITAGLGLVIITAFLIWVTVSNASEENIVLFGVVAQFSLLFF